MTYGYHEAGILTQQCEFLQRRYRRQIEFGYKWQKRILNLACSLTSHHRVTVDIVFVVMDRCTGMHVWWKPVFVIGCFGEGCDSLRGAAKGLEMCW